MRLSRHWQIRAKALGDHKDNQYIFEIDGKWKTVQCTSVLASGVKTVNQVPIVSHLTQDIFKVPESRIKALLKKLNH